MTIDVATLVFEFKSDAALTAEKRMDALITKGEQLEGQQKRLRRATDLVNEGQRTATSMADQATQANMALAQSEGAVERATRGVARVSAEVRAQRQLEAAAMRELVQATKAYERDQARAAATAARAAREQAAAVASLESRMAALKASVDPVGSAQDRVNAEMREAAALYKMGAISAEQYAQAVSVLDARYRAVEIANAGATKQMRVAQRAGLDLSRQFADIGVTAAMGMNPLMILIQQGPQIADVFAQGKAQGIGFTAMLRGIGGQIAPLLPLLAGVGLAVGVVVGAFALFEREVDKSTKGATTFGQTLQATMNVAGKAIMDSPIGDGLRWIGETFERVMNTIVNGTMSWLDRMVGFWGAAYLAIVKNWRQLPQVIGAIAIAAANNTITTIEGMVNAAIKGINRVTSVVGWKAIAEVDLPRIQQKIGTVSAEIEKDQARITAGFRRWREEGFKAIVRETERLAAAQKKGAKDAAGHASALKEVETAAEKARKEIDAYLASMNREIATAGMTPEQVKIMDAQAMAAKAIAEGYDYAAAAILAYADALILAEGKQKAWNPEIEKSITATSGLQVEVRSLEDHVRDLADAFDDVSYSFGGIVRSFKTGNFGRLIDDVMALTSSLGQLLKSGAGGIAMAGSAVAGVIGGKGGRAISGGLGLAGTGLSLGAFAESSAGITALTAAGLGTGGIAAIAGLAGPIGMAAGALYAAAKLLNVGGKPTNAGAGYDLTTGAISGNKRTSETEQAATAAGQAIQGIQDSLKAAGIGLTDSVRGLVIGTRDQTQIYLESGKTLRSAVGDSGAAVDTAMRALLESATYVSDAQKKLVDSAIAAGKGFDAVQEILAKYEAAQSISKNLADEILRLTDPKAFDLKGVTADIEAQRKAYKQLQADGYLTAEQLATINGQLATLEGLRIDEVMKRYADATEAAAAAQEEAIARFNEQIRVGLGAADVTGTTAAERQHRVARENRERAEARAAAENVEALAEQAEAARVAREGLVRLGDVAGLLATDLRGQRGSLDNGQISAAEASAARALAIELSSRALEVSNIGAVMDQLQARVNPYASGYVMRGWAGEASQALREALGPLASAVEKQQQGSIYGSGIAGVRAGRFALEQARADRTAAAYAETQARLNGALARGEITADEYAKAIATVSRYAEAIGGEAERIEQARVNLGIAGASSVVGYLDAISKSVAGLNAAAREAADPVTQVSDAIGRLNSLATVLAEGVQAAADGGSLGRGLLSTANAETALTIANAAAIAAQALTTSEAKRIAEDLAKQAAFDGASAEAIRSAAFLIEGVKAFDPASFEAGFMRLSDALIKGSVTQAQYDALFAEAMGTFQGAAEGATSALGDLRKGVRSLADQLLVGEFSTLSDPMKLGEAQRQYRSALAAARGGTADAGAVQGAVDSLLNVGRSTVATEEEFRRLFGGVYAELRGMETDLRDPSYRTADNTARIAENTDGLKATIEDLKAELQDVKAKLDTANGYNKNTAENTRQAVTKDGTVRA